MDPLLKLLMDARERLIAKSKMGHDSWCRLGTDGAPACTCHTGPIITRLTEEIEQRRCAQKGFPNADQHY